MSAVGRSCSSEAVADFQPMDCSTSAAHQWLSPPLFHIHRNVGRTLNMNRHWLSLHLGRASHHRGTVKSATQRKESQRSTRRPRRRHKQHRSNKPPTRKRVKRKSACSDTVDESSSDDVVFRRKNTRHQRESRYHTWTQLQLHTCHSSHVHIGDAHEQCSRMLCYHVNSKTYFHARRSTGIKIPSVHAIHYHCCENNYRFDALQTNCFGINIKL